MPMPPPFAIPRTTQLTTTTTGDSGHSGPDAEEGLESDPQPPDDVCSPQPQPQPQSLEPMPTQQQSAVARLDALPHELLTHVLTHLTRLCRHPRDRHWTLSQLLCVSRTLYSHTKPHVWQSVSSSMWANCETGMWMCANARAKELCRQRDPVYAQLTDVLTVPLCDRYRTVDPTDLQFTTDYAFVFECACEVLGEHWHLGGPQQATSSSSGMSSGSSESDSTSDSDVEACPLPARVAPANTTFLAPRPGRNRRRRRRRRRQHRLLNSAPSHSTSTPSSSSSSTSSNDSLSPKAVNATLLPPTFAPRLAHLTHLRRLTISSSSNVLDARSMFMIGHSLGSALLASKCRLTHLSIDISSHPGAFLTHLIPLATASLSHLTLRFMDASSSDQPRANAAADQMLRRAPHLASLVLCGRAITIGLLSTIAACPHLGTLELHGEIVDEVGQRDYAAEFWPTAGTPDLLPLSVPPSSSSSSSSSSTPTSRPLRSIHTLRLYLTGGHEPLLATIYHNLHRPLTSLEWPVALASRVYASLVLNTQSLTLQCPHNSMYLQAILNDAASSPVLTHLQLRGYAAGLGGGGAPPKPLPFVRALELVDTPPQAMVGLLSSGAVPNLGAVVVTYASAAASAHRGGGGIGPPAAPHAPGVHGSGDSDGNDSHELQAHMVAVWTAVALLDPWGTCRSLGMPDAHVRGLPEGLASVHLEVSLVPGPALDRVRSAVGYRGGRVVPYVAEVPSVAVGELVRQLAAVPEGGRARFPWVAPSVPTVPGEAEPGQSSASGSGSGSGSRQVKVAVEYHERPHWTRDASVTVVLDVRRCF